MKEAFHAVVGNPINVKLSQLSQEQRQEQRKELEAVGLLESRGKVTSDFDAVLSPEGPYSAYQERLNRWFAKKNPDA